MRWLTPLVMALALVSACCGGSDTESATSEETLEESTTDESAAQGPDLSGLHADYCIAAYVGWAMWQRDANDASMIPDEIKEDADAVARALVTHSAKYAYPPEDLGMPPGSIPTDNEFENFWGAVESLDQDELTPAFQRVEDWARLNCKG